MIKLILSSNLLEKEQRRAQSHRPFQRNDYNRSPILVTSWTIIPHLCLSMRLWSNASRWSKIVKTINWNAWSLVKRDWRRLWSICLTIKKDSKSRLSTRTFHFIQDPLVSDQDDTIKGKVGFKYRSTMMKPQIVRNEQEQIGVLKIPDDRSNIKMYLLKLVNIVLVVKVLIKSRRKKSRLVKFICS